MKIKYMSQGLLLLTLAALMVTPAVASGPDMVVSSVTGPTTGSNGNNITITDTVMNQGQGSASKFYEGIYLSTDATITTSDLLIGGRWLNIMAPGETSTLTTTATLPITLTPGTYYIGAITDVYNRVVESSETNNILAGNSISISGPDIVISSVTGPTSGSNGNIITITDTVTNQGQGPASKFYEGIYLSTDATITTSDLLLSGRWINSMAPGETSTASTTATLPTTLTPGTYYIGAITDLYNRVIESSETNNVLAGNSIAISGPDIVISSVTGPSDGSTGNSITITDTVTNQGQGFASMFYEGIYLSMDTTITTSDILISGRWLNGMAPGETNTSNTTATLPINLTPGTYYIGTIADITFGFCAPTNYLYYRVAENNEDNNALAGNSISISGPDMVISSVTGPATGSTGNSIAITDTVTNQGQGFASKFFEGIYVSRDAAITTSDMLIGGRWRSGMAPGETNTSSTTVTLPANLAPGTYYIGAIADVYNSVVENNEANNVLAGNSMAI